MTYDHWKTTEPDDGDEPKDNRVFTEADLREAVEDMRAKCEAVARGHVGTAKRNRSGKYPAVALESIRDEERGEDIAAEIIADDIRRLRQP